MRVIIFNEKIIDKGMQEILETLNRNPSVGNAIYLAITNVKGESLLKGNYSEEKKLLPIYPLYWSKIWIMERSQNKFFMF